MRRWWIAVIAVAMVTAAPAAADDFARQEAERLRADLEGEAERQRLTLETFMQDQQALLEQRLAEQDRRLARQDRMVWGLGGVCLVLAALAGGLLLHPKRRAASAPIAGAAKQAKACARRGTS